jgi:DtxR family transcriptional regulator, iron-dependent repressor
LIAEQLNFSSRDADNGDSGGWLASDWTFMNLTVSKEDYLKAIAEAESEEGAAIAVTIARWLDVSPPAVALALRRLRRDKLVQVNPKGRIMLTAAGRKISDKLRFRHHLVERMLHEILGMEWYKVHAEAERLEHSVSEDMERRLVEKLGRDGLCPHGNRIDKSAADRRKLGLQQLWEAEPGSQVRVDSMHERDRKLLEYFDRLGIRPGARLKVVGRNYDGTLSLRLNKRPTILGEAAARKVWVSGMAQRARRAIATSA